MQQQHVHLSQEKRKKRFIKRFSYLGNSEISEKGKICRKSLNDATEIVIRDMIDQNSSHNISMASHCSTLDTTPKEANNMNAFAKIDECCWKLIAQFAAPPDGT